MASRTVAFHPSPLSTAVVRQAVCPVLLVDGKMQPSILSPELLRTSIVNCRLSMGEDWTRGTVPVFGWARNAFLGRKGSTRVTYMSLRGFVGAPEKPIFFVCLMW